MRPEVRAQHESQAKRWFLLWIGRLVEKKVEKMPEPHNIVFRLNQEYDPPIPQIAIEILPPQPHWMLAFNPDGDLREFHNYELTGKGVTALLDIPTRQFITLDETLLLRKAEAIASSIKTKLKFRLVRWQLQKDGGVRKYDAELGRPDFFGPPRFIVDFAARAHGYTVGDSQIVMTLCAHTGQLYGIRVDDFEVPRCASPRMTVETARELGENHIREWSSDRIGQSSAPSARILEVTSLKEVLQLRSPKENMLIQPNGLKLVYRCCFRVSYEDAHSHIAGTRYEIIDVTCDSGEPHTVHRSLPTSTADEILSWLW